MTTKLATMVRTQVGQSLGAHTRQEAAPRRRSSRCTRGFVLPLVLLGFLASVPLASAVSANHSGTICKNYNAGDAAFIDYLPNGARSYRTYATALICPLTRNTSNSNGAYVYVDVTTYGTQTVYCTAYSYNYNGTLLGSASQSWTGSGFHEFGLNLYGAGKSSAWSDYSVLCTVPGNSSGLINGVDLSEY